MLFRPAYQRVQELAAKCDRVLPQKLRRLDSFKLLILEEIGYEALIYREELPIP